MNARVMIFRAVCNHCPRTAATLQQSTAVSTATLHQSLLGVTNSQKRTKQNTICIWMDHSEPGRINIISYIRDLYMIIYGFNTQPSSLQAISTVNPFENQQPRPNVMSTWQRRFSSAANYQMMESNISRNGFVAAPGISARAKQFENSSTAAPIPTTATCLN